MAALRPFGLIGDPVAGSVSPAIHRAGLAAAGLDADYVVVRVRREEIRDALPRLRELFAGFNVTRPLKEAIVPLLDAVSPVAARAGSVNTVIVEDGRAIGNSTDGRGFMDALRGASRDEVWPGRALVLGTGGAARAVALGLQGDGWSVAVAGRKRTAGDRLTRDLSVGFVSLEPGELSRALARADLLVNATPAGTWPERASPLPLEVPLRRGLVVFDLVYRPKRTPLLERAAGAGCVTVEGIEMLVHQAALSFELWTGLPAPLELMREAGYRALAAAEEAPSDPALESVDLVRGGEGA